ncbi:translational activator of GCN4, partial [Boothiomyces sp. JEL0838]
NKIHSHLKNPLAKTTKKLFKKLSQTPVDLEISPNRNINQRSSYASLIIAVALKKPISLILDLAEIVLSNEKYEKQVYHLLKDFKEYKVELKYSLLFRFIDIPDQDKSKFITEFITQKQAIPKCFLSNLKYLNIGQQEFEIISQKSQALLLRSPEVFLETLYYIILGYKDKEYFTKYYKNIMNCLSSTNPKNVEFAQKVLSLSELKSDLIFDGISKKPIDQKIIIYQIVAQLNELPKDFLDILEKESNDQVINAGLSCLLEHMKKKHDKKQLDFLQKDSKYYIYYLYDFLVYSGLKTKVKTASFAGKMIDAIINDSKIELKEEYLKLTEKEYEILVHLILKKQITEPKLIVWLFMNQPHKIIRPLKELKVLNKDYIPLLFPYLQIQESMWNDKPVQNSKSNACKVIEFIKSVFGKQDLPEKQEFLKELFLLLNHPAITNVYGSDIWIRICWFANCNPSFIKKELDYFMSLLELDLSPEITNSITLAIKLAPEFIPPITSLLLENMKKPEFNVPQLDLQILHADPTICFVNPLKKEQKKTLSKDQKWEEELKQKLGQASKKDMEVYNARLKVEQEIRDRTRKLQLELTKYYKLFETILNVLDIQECKAEFKKIALKVLSLVESSKAVESDEYETTYDLLDGYGNRLLEKLYVAVLNKQAFTLLSTKSNDLLKSVFETRELDALELIFLLPIIKEMVYKKDAPTDIIFLILDLLVQNSTSSDLYYPRVEVIKCLINLIIVYPRLIKPASDSILSLLISVDTVSNARELIADCEKVLLENCLDEDRNVRLVCTTGMIHLANETNDDLDVHVWILLSDMDEQIKQQAQILWNQLHTEPIKKELVGILAQKVTLKSKVNVVVGMALCEALKVYPEIVSDILDSIYQKYNELNADPVPRLDEYGMVDPASLIKIDYSVEKIGIANCLKNCSQVILSKKQIVDFFDFCINGPLNDDENVQQEFLQAGLAVLTNAKEYMKDLIALFDSYLSKENTDLVYTSIVLLLGTLAQYMDSQDPRINETVDKLIDTLATPSELVQMAVSECLPPLIKLNKQKVPALIKQLLDMLFTSEKYGHRKGAAYGLAGIIKGAGISALKDCLVMAHLKEAIEDKRNIQKREGALFAFETLSYTLGRTFEPYVIQILPHLLVCYGDANSRIREATTDTCRVIMSKLSAHCVKLVLPSLLDALKDRQYRTKIGAIEVMASMSSLAPKQLGQSLPTIIPQICEALGDSHQKVQAAAKDALTTFGKVIKNPEIQVLVPVLIQALVDPNNKTLPALSALLDTTFIHYIDAPSLALLVPIIHRGMKERSAETKKKAAQIMGNMSSLTESRDLVPYLDTLLPNLKEVLVDPVPEARGVAAKAFGSMVEKLGEQKFPTLVDELLSTLSSDSSGVDRSGSAQGLAEVLAGIGLERLEGLLPTIIANANSVKPSTREGFTTLLVYLPTTFGEKFTPYISQIVPTMLEGLADEIETVREAALHVGKVIVRNYAKSAIKLLLPQLEGELFNENWRIRQNSCQLVGELIFKIAGINQAIEMDETEGEGFGTEVQRKALLNALGQEQYEHVLASLYIVRQDSSGIVRQCSIGVWKAIVTNTPKTLKQILPILMKIVIDNLASPSLEKRLVSARTLGDLVRRLGEQIVTLIIPIIEEGLGSENEETREGALIGLTEMMNQAGKSLSDEFMPQCVPLIRAALVDSSDNVRAAAAKAFDNLHQQLGSKAIDDIIPVLLKGLKNDKDGYVLEGLKEIMNIRSNVVFPVLIPTLLKSPMSAMNIQALGSLISVAGQALNKRLSTIIKALFAELLTSEYPAEIKQTLEILMSTIEEEGIYLIIGILTEAITDDSVETKISACECLTQFFNNTQEAFEDHIPDVLPLLISLFNDENKELVQQSWNAVDALVKRIRKDDLDRYVKYVRKGISDCEQYLGYGEEIAAFNLPKGISPLLSIFLQGLLNGAVDIREISAYGLGDLIARSSELSLKPFVTQITGPLIRIIGDRFPASVKTAILSTFGLLLTKVPANLKPFLPQLQRTFVKCLSEAGSTANMRNKTAQCLSLLIPLQARLDPLVMELIQGIKQAEKDVQPAIWQAMYGLLKGISRSSGKSISEASLTSIKALITESLLSSGENGKSTRQGAAKCFGALCGSLPLVDAESAVTELINQTGQEWTEQEGLLLALEKVFVESSEVVENSETLKAIILECTISNLRDKKAQVAEAAVSLAAQVLRCHTDETLVLELIEITRPSTESTDARRNAIVALKNFAKTDFDAVKPLLDKLVPAFMVSIRDRVIPIKLAAERALVYILQIKAGTQVLDTYLTKLDAPSARSIGDYARRVLMKIGERDSDNEDNE